MITPVILSGGSGARLWPMSRPRSIPSSCCRCFEREPAAGDGAAGRPIARASPRPLIVANDEHVSSSPSSLRQCGDAAGHHPRAGRAQHRARAAAIAALMLAAADPALAPGDASDHAVADPAAFAAALARAAGAARAGALVTFGIAADRPETVMAISGAAPLAGQDAATRSPPRREADPRARRKLSRAGDYFWNSGIFLFPAGLYLDELTRRHPEMVASAAPPRQGAARSRLPAPRQGGVRRPCRRVDRLCGDELQARPPWSGQHGLDDIGSWDALWSMGAKGRRRERHPRDVVAADTRNSYLRAEEAHDRGARRRGPHRRRHRRRRARRQARPGEDIKMLVARLDRAGPAKPAPISPCIGPGGPTARFTLAIASRSSTSRSSRGRSCRCRCTSPRRDWVVVSAREDLCAAQTKMLLHKDQSTYIRSAFSTGWRTPQIPAPSHRGAVGLVSRRDDGMLSLL